MLPPIKLIILGIVFLSWPQDVPRGGERPTITRSVASETTRDEPIERAMLAFFDYLPLTKGDLYFYNRVDINGDGEPEVLAYPAGNCGTAGCGLLIMKKEGDEYKTVTHIDTDWTLFIVSTERTNGWNDLILWNQYSKDNPRYGYYAVLKYDGKSYPIKAWGAPPMEESVEGTRYLHNPATEEFGVRIQ